MNRATLYHPFSHLLREFGHGVSPNAGFRVDIEEDESQYRIHADLPGVSRKQVSVNVENNVLSVGAKLENGGEHTVHSERASGEVQRSFRLPRRVDASAIAASMKDGVLTVVLPKAESDAGRKIEIH